MVTHEPQFTVLTPVEFVEDIQSRAPHASTRVWFQAMEVEPGEHTDILLKAAADAAKRGVDARFHADWYTMLVTDGTFNYWPFVSGSFRRQRVKRLQKKKAMAQMLRGAGVRFLFTNPPTPLDLLLPTRGRNHMKIAVIDDTAWIGGVNFHKENFEASDIMIRISDPQVTGEIAYVYALIDDEQHLRDMAISCTDETTLLVDGGTIDRSLILRLACALVERAEQSVKVIAPLIPDASFLTALQAARTRGIPVTVIAPRVEAMSGVYQLVDTFNQALMQLKGTRLPITFREQMVHAKVLIVDEQEAIVGSHNFSSRGVRMGTEEIALQSTNKQLIARLLDYYLAVTA